MGVIQRQAIKSSIINWSGVLLGILNVVLIVPHVLEAYGVYTFIMSAVSLLIPFVSLGLGLGSVKFFNDYAEEGSRDNRSVLRLSIIIIAAGYMCFLLFVLLAKDWIVEYYQGREPEKYMYLVFVIPFVLVFSLMGVLTTYTSNFKRIVVPALLRNLIKFILPIFLLLHLWEYIDVWGLLYCILGLNALVVIALFVYLKFLGELDFRWSPDFFTPQRRVEMRKYLVNGVFLSAGTVIAASIDAVMVGSMIEIGTATAVYSIGVVVASILILPNNAVASIAGPIIAKLWAEDNQKDLAVIYKKASINLFIIGVLLFVGIWSSIDDVFGLMKNGSIIAQAKYVIFFLALARLFSMSCGVNGLMVQLSPNYIIGTYSILFLAVVNIIMNYYLIKAQGVVGAAIATSISILLYNLSLVVYLYFKNSVQPFSIRLFLVIAFGVLAYAAGLIIGFESHLLNILLRSLLIFLVFVPLIYYAKVSSEINDVIDTFAKKTKGLVFGD